MFRRPISALIVALGLMVVACGGGNDPDLATPSATSAASGAPQVTGVPAGDAEIKISSPADGATVKAGKVSIVTEVAGFALVDKVGDKAKQGEGHIIYYLGSGYEIPSDPAYPANIGGQGTFTSYMSAEKTYEWPDVRPGRQTFTVQLVNNDNTPLAPPRSAQVEITVS
jgi:hypothetical protein